jgi:hypothetical protein
MGNNHLIGARLGTSFRTMGSPFSFLKKTQSFILRNKKFRDLASPKDIG